MKLPIVNTITSIFAVISHPKLSHSKLDSLQLSRFNNDPGSLKTRSPANSELDVNPGHYSLVTDLNVTTVPFGQEHCLLFVANFGYSDIAEVDHPFILRSPEPFYHQNLEGVWLPKNLFPPNRTYMAEGDEKYIYRKYGKFVRSPISQELFSSGSTCLILDILLFIGSSKPWNCIADFSLFPSNKILHRKSFLKYPTPFAYIWNTSVHNFFPVGPAAPVVLVTINQNYNDEVIYRCKTGFIAYYTHTCIYNIFMFVKVKKKVLVKNLEDPTYHVEKFFAIKLYHNSNDLRELGYFGFHQYRDTVSYVQYVPLKASDLHNLGTISKLAFPLESESINWVIRDGWIFEILSEEVFYNLNHCNVQNFYSSLRTSNRSFLAVGRSDVFKSLMKNFTFQRNIGKVLVSEWCDNGKIYKALNGQKITFNLHIEVKRSMIQSPPRGTFDIALNNIPFRLRFLTCGERSKGSIAYRELINVYTLSVWILILLTTLFVAITIKVISKSEKCILFHLLPIIKILLEQGDPFSDSIRNNYHLRWNIGLFLLAALVLSNAYKNDNVYRMISPRTSLPYEKLSQLVQDKVTLYTRAETIMFNINNIYPDLDPNISLLWNSNHEIQGSAFVNSEILTLLRRAADSHRITRKSVLKLGNDPGVSLMHVYEQSRLHPRVKKVLRTLLGRVLREFRSLKDSVFLLSFLDNATWFLKRNIMKSERRIILETIGNCTKTAVLLPEDVAVANAKFLVRQNVPLVHIGQEVYTDPHMDIRFKGTVPPYVYRRLYSLEASGIWDWWTNLFRSHVKIGYWGVTSVPKKPAMDGNILLVFFLLGYGFSVATVMFMLEKGKWFVLKQCVFVINKVIATLTRW